MDNTIVQQGYFVADGENKRIPVRSDIDWMTVWNLTEIAATTADHGVRYYWQRGIEIGAGGFVEYHPAADNTLAIDVLGLGAGFSLLDTSDATPGVARAVTNVANAVAPQIDAANTTGLQDGSIIRLVDVANVGSLCGFDFEIDTIVDGVSFEMRYAMANAAGAVGGAGFYRHIPYDPMYYPRFRYIVDITQVVTAVVSTSVRHGYTVGQQIRINVPSNDFGMVEIHQLEGTIIAVTADTITTDIDSSTFTAFRFALPAEVPFSYPTVVPLGEDTSTAIAGGVDMLADATRNTAFIGMELVAGVLGPAGSTDDIIFWQAGKAFRGLIIG